MPVVCYPHRSPGSGQFHQTRARAESSHHSSSRTGLCSEIVCKTVKRCVSGANGPIISQRKPIARMGSSEHIASITADKGGRSFGMPAEDYLRAPTLIIFMHGLVFFCNQTPSTSEPTCFHPSWRCFCQSRVTGLQQLRRSGGRHNAWRTELVSISLGLRQRIPTATPGTARN